MKVEGKRIPAVVVAMFGLVLSDPEILLFDYARAVSKGDKDSLETAQFLKQKAEELGVTEERFQEALEAMETTSKILDEASTK